MGTIVDPGPLERALSGDGEHDFITRFWTVDDLTRRYRVTARYLRAIIKDGKFPRGRWVMGRLRFLRADVLAVEQQMLESGK